MFKQVCVMVLLLGGLVSGVASAGVLTGSTANGTYAVSPLAAGFTAAMTGGSGTSSEAVVDGSSVFMTAVTDNSDGSFASFDGVNPYTLYFVDVQESGLITVFNNIAYLAPMAAGSQIVTLSFSGLSAAIDSFTSSDPGAALSVLDASTVSLDLSGIAWGDAYSTYSAQLGFAPVAALPEPASLGLLALGIAGLVLSRRVRG